MIAQAVAEACHELLIRELLERAALRDMCLRALTADSGQGAIEVRVYARRHLPRPAGTRDNSRDGLYAVLRPPVQATDLVIWTPIG